MLLLHDHVVAQAKRRPDSEAVVDGAARLSYRELDGLSNQTARCLRARGVRRGDLVLVLGKRSASYLASVIGVLKAGAAYVPLEARTPEARRAQIVADCRPKVVLCDDAELAEALVEAPPLVVGADEIAAAEEPTTAPDVANTSIDDLACVIYTSGSTGSPKGVMLSHGNIDAYVQWAVERIGIGADDRLLGTAPFYFDMSLFDIYATFRAGATLCVATERVLMFPKTLLKFAEDERVTVWKGIASLLMYLSMTRSLSAERLPTLRTVLFAGEALPTKYLIDWMTTFPDKAFYNAYGPTEATGVSMVYRVPKVPAGADEKTPIGIPCENTVLRLLDAERKPVAPGQQGEIALGGPCICVGYLNDPDKTAAAIIEDPQQPGQRLYLSGDYARQLPDGNYEFLGRRDNQIKFMGYRLELSDIENALVAIEGVVEAGALLGEPARAGVNELIAYVVLAGSRSVAEVKAELKKALPHYMQPKQLLSIDKLPRGDRGKIDRAALAAQHRERQAAR